MAAVEVRGLTYRYGKHVALDALDLTVPDGAFYALLGPNGSGKTTLLQILAGTRHAPGGLATIAGTDVRRITPAERARVGYVAEGQRLPRWMRLEQLEAYLAPLHPDWDRELAAHLRDRFGLDGRRRVGTLSRGEHMKAALLCALAPRPRLLIMDEPFTGMDALVKDELVRGLLDSAAGVGTTVLIASHDIAELEHLADWVGYIHRGRVLFSETVEDLRRRFKRATVTLAGPAHGTHATGTQADEWLNREWSGRRVSFVAPNAADDFATGVLPQAFPAAERIEVEDLSLKEIFVAVTRDMLPRQKGEA